jgi:hypothetical protein
MNEIWSRCADSRFVVYAFFAIIYVPLYILQAHHKLMWDDEFFTLYLSKTSGWNDLWTALSTGADQHPPSFYYLTHLIFMLAGTSHITLRLTALFGFGLCCICSYEIVRNLMGRRWAVPALLLPLTCPASYYATEARGYGLELGFVTLALLTWVLATEGRKRIWTVPALGVGLCLAVASHYYAILVLLPLLIGELIKRAKRGALDIPVCCSLIGSLLPLLVFLPLILHARSYSVHFWAKPSWQAALWWYPDMIGLTLLVMLGASAVAFIWFRSPSASLADAPHRTSFPVAITLTVSAILPVIGAIVAHFITHAYTDRYFIAALPGSLIISLLGLRRVFQSDTVGPVIASVFCVVLVIQEWRNLRARQTLELYQLQSIASLLRRAPAGPIVLSEITLIHRLSFYSHRDLAKRFVYLADPHLALRYLGFDTIDRGMLDLAPWFPLNIVWWRQWWIDHPFSMMYGYIGSWAWSTFALRDVGSAQLLSRDGDHLLFAVTRDSVPPDDRVVGDPPGKPRLFDRLSPDGPQLCKVYMPEETCLVVGNSSAALPRIAYPDMLPSK